jgi:glycine betaine/proline transport system ATP-binding protein
MLLRDGRVRQIGTPSDILNRPVDEHVAEFVADVDRTRVLTARDVMRQPVRVASPAEPAADVLAWLESAGLRGVYVVDAGRIVGVAPADSLRRAGAGPVEHAATESSFATTALDTPLIELCDRVGGSSVPLAVVDDDGRLAGVVPRSAVVDGIARSMKEDVHA